MAHDVSNSPAHDSKGSFAAKFWAVWCCRKLKWEHPECAPVIEDARKGKAADVGVVLEGRWIAYEIQLSEKHVVENSVKDVLAGYDEVVVCVLTDEMAARVLKQLEKTLWSDAGTDVTQGRVRTRLLREFLE